MRRTLAPAVLVGLLLGGWLAVPSPAQIKQGGSASATNLTGVVAGANGGTGVANTSKTITLGGNLTTSGANNVTFTTSGATNVTLPTTGTLITSASLTGELLGVQIITATGAGTYTPTAGTGSVILEMVGGGGGGGSVAANPGASTSNMGIGGSGGAYIWVRLTANFSGASYSVGAKGTGGASGGNNAGTAGGNTTFTDTAGSPTTYTAGGGGAGNAGTSLAVASIRGFVAGGTATNGTLTKSGGPSTAPIYLTAAVGSFGGNSQFGQGGHQAAISANGTQAGANGTGKGSGGGGALNNGVTSASQAGGDGTDGLILIWEYR